MPGAFAGDLYDTERTAGVLVFRTGEVATTLTNGHLMLKIP
jgi:hypothetical protein